MIVEFQSESLKGVEFKIDQYLKHNDYEVVKIITYPYKNIWVSNVEFRKF